MVAACACDGVLSLLAFPYVDYENGGTLEAFQHAATALTPRFISARCNNGNIRHKGGGGSVVLNPTAYCGVSVLDMVFLKSTVLRIGATREENHDPVVALVVDEARAEVRCDGRKCCEASTASLAVHIRVFRWKLDGDGALRPCDW